MYQICTYTFVRMLHGRQKSVEEYPWVPGGTVRAAQLALSVTPPYIDGCVDYIRAQKVTERLSR